MKFMHMSAHVVCILALSLLSACYSPDRFRSPSADILVAWGNPEYRIVFEKAGLVTGVNECSFEFSNPPSLDLQLYLVFLSREDVERLRAHNAQLAVEVTDSDGLVVYERQALIGDLRTPSPFPGLEIRPPDGWSSEPKGNVVRETHLWQCLDRSKGQDVWAFAVPYMCVVQVGDNIRLGSKDYRLHIAITFDGADEPPIQFYSILAGGWYGSL